MASKIDSKAGPCRICRNEGKVTAKVLGPKLAEVQTHSSRTSANRGTWFEQAPLDRLGNAMTCVDDIQKHVVAGLFDLKTNSYTFASVA
jgi:hypothetical protein